MSEIRLTPFDFAYFTVPHAVCVAGEFQDLFGQGSICVAAPPRLAVGVTETGEPFSLTVQVPGASAPQEAAGAWAQALGRNVLDDPRELDGLWIRLGHEASGEAERELAEILTAEELLAAPAVAAALTCAVRSYRGRTECAESSDLARCAAVMLGELAGADAPVRYAECTTCLEGGARHVVPLGRSINAQLLMPPDSLILAVRRELPPAGLRNWRQAAQDALSKLDARGTAGLALGEDGLAEFFDAAGRRLTDQETTLLYGLGRVREMVAAHVERLDRNYLDHDLLAELCDEESSILQDYFGFPGADFAALRRAAFGAGALGGKFTYAFGSRPAVVILAPGCRADVLEALAPFEDYALLPVDVETDGVRSEAGAAPGQPL